MFFKKKQPAADTPETLAPAPTEGLDTFEELPEDILKTEESEAVPDEGSVFYEPVHEGAEPLPDKRELRRQARAAKQAAKAEQKQQKGKTRFSLPGAGALASLRRLIRFFLVVLLCYLAQVCIMPYVRVSNVTPNLMIVLLAVVIVTSGRIRAFWAAAIFGILLDAMLPAINFVTLLLYPVATLFWSLFLADKTEKQLEADRAMNRPARSGNVYIRTLIGSLLLSLTYELVNLAYIFLGGTALNIDHYARSLTGILLTTALTAVLMFPLRCLLGFRHPPKEEEDVTGRYLNRKA